MTASQRNKSCSARISAGLTDEACCGCRLVTRAASLYPKACVYPGCARPAGAWQWLSDVQELSSAVAQAPASKTCRGVYPDVALDAGATHNFIRNGIHVQLREAGQGAGGGDDRLNCAVAAPAAQHPHLRHSQPLPQEWCPVDAALAAGRQALSYLLLCRCMHCCW